jgi:hypothetical protein
MVDLEVKYNQTFNLFIKVTNYYELESSGT